MKHLDLTLISQQNVNEDWSLLSGKKKVFLPPATCYFGRGLGLRMRPAGPVYTQPSVERARSLRSPHPKYLYRLSDMVSEIPLTEAHIIPTYSWLLPQT